MIRGNVGLLDGIFYFDADDIVPVGPVVEGAQPEMTPLPSNFDKASLLMGKITSICTGNVSS